MSRDERLKAIEQRNLSAALVIIADPERYGGETALCVLWARSVLLNLNRLPLTEGKQAA
jgi:hypothetical protein